MDDHMALLLSMFITATCFGLLSIPFLWLLVCTVKVGIDVEALQLKVLEGYLESFKFLIILNDLSDEQQIAIAKALELIIPEQKKLFLESLEKLKMLGVIAKEKDNG